MATKRTKLSDQLRKAIETSGRSQYAICREAELAQATLCRFMQGKGGLSVDGIDRLAEALGLELVQRPPKKGR